MAVASGHRLLLHLWSPRRRRQFYLCWPLVIALPRALGHALLGLAVRGRRAGLAFWMASFYDPTLRIATRVYVGTDWSGWGCFSEPRWLSTYLVFSAPRTGPRTSSVTRQLLGVVVVVACCFAFAMIESQGAFTYAVGSFYWTGATRADRRARRTDVRGSAAWRMPCVRRSGGALTECTSALANLALTRPDKTLCLAPILACTPLRH